MHLRLYDTAGVRPSGLDAVGDIPWGTHLCQFYRTRDDLLDVLVPYFKAGLDANERCLWITAEPLGKAEATSALELVVPDISERLRDGQIEILDYREWYLRTNGLSADDALRGWLSYEAAARATGYDGLRITGNTMFVERDDWESFAQYEALVHRGFHSQRILALCSYSFDKCTANDIIDVLRNHQFALVRRDGEWQTIQSATQVLATIRANTGKLTASAPVRIPPPAQAHTVRFFEPARYPATDIAEYLHASVIARGGAIVYATPPHLTAIKESWAALGVDFTDLIETGQLITRDAENIARAVLTGHGPDEAAFRAIAAADAQKVLDQFDRVHVYGEVVNVLAANGDCAAAIQLESWWNSLLQDERIALLCGYALDNFARADSMTDFRRVCTTHHTVEPMRESEHGDPGRLAAELEQAIFALRAESSERQRAEREQSRLREAQHRSLLQARSVNEHLACLQQLTAAIAEATTLSEISRAVIAGLEQAFSADVTALALPLDDRNQLSVISRIATTAPTTIGSYVVATDSSSPLARAYHTRESVWLLSPKEIFKNAPALFEQLPDAHVVGCMPLVLRDRCLGAVGLLYRTPHPQEAAQRALFEDYVKQIALAVERANSYEEAHRARARLQLLADAGRRIAEAKLDLGRVMENIVREVTRADFAHCALVCLRNDDVDTLSLVALHHIDERRRAEAGEMLRTTPVRVGEGVLGTVAKTGVPIRLTSRDDVFRHFRKSYLGYLKRYPLTTFLAVPLRTSNGVLGVISASRDFPASPFLADEEQFLQDLADRAALSVENALLYERARQERERAETANAAKDEFLAMLGHELRNPLSPILTASQLMRLRGGDMLAKERTIIERQVRHMVRLVDDLLDISRITQGKIDLKRAPIELVQVVANAVEIASPLLEERRHRLIASIPSSGLRVDADASRLAQVIANLLTNAAKYTPPEGTIKVTASERHRTVMLCVADNGIGIDSELMPRIFNSFAQGKQESDRAKGGLGLGLTIARSLAELHGGTLTAVSDGRDQGSEFILTLPLAEHSESRTDETHSPIVDPLSSGRKILVVDDNADAADSLCEALAMLGHTTRAAYDGPSALPLAESFRPHLALLDIGLPAMDGYELAERMREALGGNSPKLVALTGYGQVADRQRSQDAGFANHIVKPVDFERLQAVIDELFALSPA